MQEARSFFENEILSTMPSQPGPEGNKTPLWDQAKMVKINLGDAVVVPIDYERPQGIKAEGEKNFRDLQKSSYLLIYKDKSQNMQAEWVSLAPMGEKKNDKFVGIISVHEWNGKPKHAFAFNQNGNVALMQETNVFFRKASLRNSVLCYNVDYTYVDITSGYAVVIGYSRTNCILINDFDFNTRSHETEYFGSGGDNGGGGYSGVDPYQYSDKIDCAGIVGGIAIFSKECQTCIGGATGIDRCDPLDIINKVTDPCLRPLVESLINSNVSGKISEIISKLNGDTKVTVTFTDVELTSNNKPAMIGPISARNGIYPIALSRLHLKETTKENVTAVIIHEVIHAFLNYSGQGNAADGIEHETIALNYVNPMANYLIKLYGLSEKDAIGLAWSGLSDSKSYINNNVFKYSQGNLTKAEIQDTYRNFISGKSGILVCE
jgi:hypothetical protein